MIEKIGMCCACGGSYSKAQTIIADGQEHCHRCAEMLGLDEDEEWTPGSPEAIEAGCTCPRGDNCNGLGMPSEDGPLFWVNGSCPLHGEEQNSGVHYSHGR